MVMRGVDVPSYILEGVYKGVILVLFVLFGWLSDKCIGVTGGDCDVLWQVVMLA